jgi:oxygen-dependent protoporphyrinogen oxidase
MSLKSCFPRIHELEQEFGGLLKAMIMLAKKKRAEVKAGKQVASAAGPGGVLTSFVGGIQELTDAMVKNIQGEVRIGSPVAGLKPVSGGWEMSFADGSTFDADIVVSAAPAHVLKGLCQPFDSNLYELLEEIPYAPMNVICFGYEREKIARDLDGFGYLIPKKEGCEILGTLWDSSIFPQRAPEGHVLLRSMMGGATNPDAINLSDAEVKEKTMVELKKIMGVSVEPDFVRIFRHQRAIPQYVVGHAERLLALEENLKHHPGLIFTGNAFFGVGLNDCVNAANKAGEQVISCLQ